MPEISQHSDEGQRHDSFLVEKRLSIDKGYRINTPFIAHLTSMPESENNSRTKDAMNQAANDYFYVSGDAIPVLDDLPRIQEFPQKLKR